jgi:hypothetical protein
LSKPVAICVAEVSDVFNWGVVKVPVQLLDKLLPGPVTLCFEKFPELNPEFNSGLSIGLKQRSTFCGKKFSENVKIFSKRYCEDFSGRKCAHNFKVNI